MQKKVFFLNVIILFFLRAAVLYAQDSESGIESFAACEGSIQCISENASGSLIAVSDSSCVNIYDTRDNSLVCRFYDEKVSRIVFFTEGENEFVSVITKAGQFIVRKLVNYDGVWHCEDGEPYYSADCADGSGRKALTAVSFSNNSDYVAAAFSDNTVQVHFRLRVTAGTISRTISSHKSQIYGLEFSKNGEYLATVSTDGQAYVWNSYTGSKITQLNGIYTRARVPVLFTEDSVYIISQDGRNSFRISDFSGNSLYSIVTGRPVTDIKALKDPDLLAIRNDKNEVMIYSISSRRPLSVASVEADKSFTVYEFTPNADLMYAGFKDGSLQRVEPQPYLDEKEMLVTDSSLVGTGGGKGVKSPFSSISITAGTNYLQEPYLLSGNLRFEYLYSEAVSPFFFGGGLLLSAGFPRKEFPASYKLRGEEVKPPYLTSAGLYAPFGYAFTIKKGMIVLTSFKAGVKVSSLAIISGGDHVIGNPALSFFGSAGAGMQIKFFEFDINCEYDTIGKLSPSLYLGYVKRWGEK